MARGRRWCRAGDSVGDSVGDGADEMAGWEMGQEMAWVRAISRRRR